MAEQFPGRRSKEGRESQELFRATLGFDFVFERDEKGGLHCYCIEFNGHDTGVHGVEDVPEEQMDRTQRTLAGVRASGDPEMARKYTIANAILKDLHTEEFKPTPEGKKKIMGYLQKSIRTQPTFIHAYHNPDFIEDVTRDKRLQAQFIPEEYRPRIWHPGDSPSSPTGGWVLKPYGSRGGDGVHVVTNEQFKELLDNAFEPFPADTYVVQEFLSSGGAELAPETVGKRAASMRLLMDFRVLKDGSIQTDYSTAYQRVSPHGVHEPGMGATERFVVNRARGAGSAGVSERELALAKKAAEDVIHNLTTAYVGQMKGASAPSPARKRRSSR